MDISGKGDSGMGIPVGKMGRGWIFLGFLKKGGK
jgi:hypothetical protein